MNTITYLVIAIPEGDGTYGWTKPESFAVAQQLLEFLYAGKFSGEQIMGSFMAGYRNAVTGEINHIFCDSLRNLLGDRFEAGFAPQYVEQMSGAVTDLSCKWALTENPQAVLTGWGLEPVPSEAP